MKTNSIPKENSLEKTRVLEKMK